MSDTLEMLRDMQEIERRRKARRTSALGGIASLGVAGVGGYKRNKALAASGLSAAFLSGLTHGHQKKKEREAINRLMKEAAVDPHVLAPIVGSGALLSDAARRKADDAMNWRQHAYTSAKDTMGKPMTPDERLFRAKALTEVARQEKIDTMKPGIWKWLRNKFNAPNKPTAWSGQHGEWAGQHLKELHKVAPEFSDAALEAIKDDRGLERFNRRLTGNLDEYKKLSKNVEKLVDTVPGAKFLFRNQGKSPLLTQALDNPAELNSAVRRITRVANNTVRGGKAMALAGGLAALGYAAGNMNPFGSAKEKEAPFTTMPPSVLMDRGQMPTL